MKNKKLLIVLAVLAVIVVAAAAVLIYMNANKPMTEAEMAKVPPTVVVTMTTDGFSPNPITVKKGQAVEFVNGAPAGCSPDDATCDFWPASDPHPTHTDYPQFDPKQPIGPGETWSFVFERIGTWGYHDHFKPRNHGTVTVTP